MPIIHTNFPVFIKLLPAMSLLLLMGCSEPPAEEKIIRPVKSILVEEHLAAEIINMPGKVRAADKVDLSFQVSGRMTKINILSGQRVTEGTLLAELDSRDFDSNLKAARAEYRRANSDFLRTKELVEKQLVSKADFDFKRARKDIAEADLEKATKAVSDSQLKAPFSGLVAARYVTKFQDVQAKQPIISLQDISSLEVVIYIPENGIPRDFTAEERENIDAVAKFEDVAGQVFPLHLKEYSAEADSQTQLFTLIFEMDYPESLSIFPGMSVGVEITIPSSMDEHYLLLPSTAIFADKSGSDQQYVWLVDAASHTVSKQAVTLGMLRSDKIEIISGVEPGMRVITAGVNYLFEGETVRLMNANVGM